MSQRPHFITMMDDRERRTLLVRQPEDYNYFVWGPITKEQEQTLEDCGVFDLTDIPVHLGITEDIPKRRVSPAKYLSDNGIGPPEDT